MENHMFGPSRRLRRRTSPAVLMAVTLFVVGAAGVVSAADADRSLTVPREFQRRSLGQRVSGDLGQQLSSAISSLYNGGLSADDRLAAGDQIRALLSEDALSGLRQSIGRRVDLVSAGIQVSQLASLSDEQRAAASTLVAAANRFEDTCSEEDAGAVRAAWLQLLPSEDAMAIVRPVFMRHYFNHNMHVTMSEYMLSKFVSDYRTRSGTIAECILGAWVTGSQNSNASVRADIKRSADSGHFLLRLDGQVTSNTQGRRKPATIFTRGRHNFKVTSPVFFDGETLTTGQASIDVNTNNQTVGVRTDLDWLPIFGGIARSIARKKAAEKRGQSEYIAAQKIAKEALPEFVEEANKRFADANKSIQEDLFAGLNAKGVGPDSLSSRSSESHLAVSSRTMGDARLGGTSQQFGPLPARGLAFQVHETAINNIIDGLELGGRTIPEDQFVDELSKSLSELLQRDIQLGDDEEDAESEEDQAADAEPEPPTVFTFDEVDPVRVRIEDNAIVLVLRVVIQEEGSDALPRHRIEFPVGIGMSGTDIALTPPEKLTSIRTTALEPVNAVRRAGIANQIRRILSRQLPERKVDGGVSVKASDDKTIELQTIDISGQDGWLYVELK